MAAENVTDRSVSLLASVEDTGIGIETEEMKQLKVLVVDDNRASRLMLEEMLEAFSFSVDDAANGIDGIESLRKADAGGNPYNIALIDWRMPGIDGYELCSKLKDSPKTGAFSRGGRIHHKTVRSSGSEANCRKIPLK